MFELSQEGRKFVEKELGRYESKRSAIIPCLYRAQQENGGWISPEVIAHLSELMGFPEAMVHEVFTFYTMFNRQPVGKYHVQVCGNISCAMNGSRELLEELSKTLGGDSKFVFSRVECLGSCGTAPMMQVNDDYHENLTAESAIQLLRNLP